MIKRISEQLSDLSVKAKNVETAVAAAQKEGYEKLVHAPLKRVRARRRPSTR